MAQFEEPGVRDGAARGEGWGVEGVGGGGGDGGVRGWLAFAEGENSHYSQNCTGQAGGLALLRVGR